MMDSRVIAVLGGFLLDLLLGDPRWLYHPVRLIGNLITGLERVLLPEKKPGEAARSVETACKEDRRETGSNRKVRILQPEICRERLAGAMLVVLVTGSTALTVGLILQAASLAGKPVKILVEMLLCYFLFAVKSLRDESMKVYRELVKPDLPAARYAVSMIVGRDTDRLDEAGVTKAAVETVAENTSDGIIAPMLCMVIGGPLLGWIYKSINTMDSMVGYKNDRYLNFGRYAAKLDDVVNFIPARISALLMTAACPIVGLDAGNGWRIFCRDRYNHASPNSAQTEAVMAGALHVQLAGDAWYFGKRYEKKTIGDPDRPVEPEDIRRANRLLYAASVLGLAVFLVVRLLLRRM